MIIHYTVQQPSKASMHKKQQRHSYIKKHTIVLIKMFSRWFLAIFHGKTQNERDSKLTSKIHKIKV